MDFKKSDVAGLRQHLAEALSYASYDGHAVEILLRRGRRVWLVGDGALRKQDMTCVGVLEAAPRMSGPYRRRMQGMTDILGEEFRRIGLRLYGQQWRDALSRVLGISDRAVVALARRRDVAIPRDLARKVKGLCKAERVDWRVV